MTVIRMGEPDLRVLDQNVGLKDAALSVLVGRQLAEGCYRRVFELRGDPTKVLKLEAFGDMFCNQMEWRTWREVEHTKWAEWFAPCVSIDAFGGALVMERTKPIEDWPEGKRQRLPAFFTDVKPENFGLLDGRLVCHDYGSTLLMLRGMRGAKLVPVHNLPGDHCYEQAA